MPLDAWNIQGDHFTSSIAIKAPCLRIIQGIQGKHCYSNDNSDITKVKPQKHVPTCFECSGLSSDFHSISCPGNLRSQLEAFFGISSGAVFTLSSWSEQSLKSLLAPFWNNSIGHNQQNVIVNCVWYCVWAWVFTMRWSILYATGQWGWGGYTNWMCHWPQWK